MSYFHPGECSFGYAFYAAVLGIVLAMLCGLLSLKVEKATLNPSIKRRIEEGNERLVFARWAHNTQLLTEHDIYIEKFQRAAAKRKDIELTRICM